MKKLNYESPTLEIICMEAQHCFATSGPVSSQVGLDDLDAVDADWNYLSSKHEKVIFSMWCVRWHGGSYELYEK